MVCSRQEDTDYDNRVRCLQHGMGARQGKLQTGGRWSQAETIHHIKYLELLAAFLALRCFTKHSNRITVQMKLDNVVTVTYINKRGGGTHSQPLCQLALTIWEWCVQRNVFLVAEHLPGKGQHNRRLGIAINKRSLRLDVKSSGLPEDSTADVATANRFIYILTE